MAGFNRKVLTVANLIISLSILSECLNIKVHKDKELFEISPHLYGFTFEVYHPLSLPSHPRDMYQ